MKRLTGLDLARSLALMGMVCVNIPLVFSALDTGAAAQLMDLMAGRAAALFVVLAGAGNSLMTRGGRQDSARAAHDRGLIVRRALFLFVLGIGWLPLWPGDILHFYGVWMLMAAGLFTLPTRALLPLAALFTLAFPVLLAVGPSYETAWDWETFTYADLWTPRGFLRNTFYNGLHPVFPWFAFYLGGMWLGRQDLDLPRRRRRLLAVLVPLWLLMEALGIGLTQALLDQGLSPVEADAIGGVSSMPPMPQYVLGAGAAAMVVILVCIPIAERLPRLCAPLVATGQLALTHYASHVFLLLYPLALLCAPETLDLPGAPRLRMSGPLILGAMATWGALSVGLSWAWRRRFPRGPLEWVMRRLTTPQPQSTAREQQA